MKGEETPGRLRAYVAEYGKQYPGVWRALDEFRTERGKGLPMWREWCYVPIHAAFAYLTNGKRMEDISPPEIYQAAQIAGIISALGAWRLTQGVYRFHEKLFQPVWDTPVSGELPVELLFHLPEWCMYVETPGKDFAGTPLRGFFAHIDDDLNYNRAELRLLLDMEAGLNPFVLHLNKSTISESIEAVAEHSTRMTQGYPALVEKNSFTPEFKRTMAERVSPLISLLLYICSATEDMRDSAGGLRRSKNPTPKRVKGE